MESFKKMAKAILTLTDEKGNRLDFTPYTGPEGNRNMVQLSVNMEYVCLDRDQQFKLLLALVGSLKGED